MSGNAFERGIGSVADAVGFLWELLSQETAHDLAVERGESEVPESEDEWEADTDPGFIDTDGEAL